MRGRGADGCQSDGMAEKGQPECATVSVRSQVSLGETSTEWERVPLDAIVGAAPWRTFRWHRGQKHYSGTYWSSTEQRHVIYESRLELTRLLFADFDGRVRRIIAQPFLLRATVERRERKHVPDYLLLTNDGPIVVDVKPHARLARPKITFTLDWTRRLVEQRGWRYEVWSEPPETELANIRFLAGFRNQKSFSPTLLDELTRRDDLPGRTLGEACTGCSCWPEPVVRSAILHLVWSNHLAIELTGPLRPTSVLRKGVRS
jgi:hypothetical protein